MFFAPERHERLLGPGLIALVALVGAWPVHIGRIVSARWFLASGIWIAFTLIATFTGGVRAPVALGYPVFIVMCGWQIGARAAMIAVGATVLAVVSWRQPKLTSCCPLRRSICPPCTHRCWWLCRCLAPP
ncbi:MAG: hypothetical protein IPF55_09570 [Rhodoferax sp.]|nr:hypothetical protein [Rhodoferax sp.]